MRSTSGRTRSSIDWSASSTPSCLWTSLVFEALSVLCRRAAERNTSPPDLQAAIAIIRGWFEGSEVRFLARESERLAGDVLDVIGDSGGVLNANDALLVVLARERAIDNFASFDSGFDNVEGLRRIS